MVLTYLQNLILATLWVTMMMMTMAKTTKTLCLLLTLFSIMVAAMISTITKLTLISFIVILTMAGGLMILFLYFTASLNQKEHPPTMPIMNNILITSMVIASMAQTPFLPPNTLTPLSESMDPAVYIFTYPWSSLTVLMMLTLGVVLAAVIEICSKAGSFIRKKKWI